jgi:hypothetical protein
MKSLIFGGLAGLAGAALWAAISYGTGYEVGYVAWAIGGLVGFACAKGSERGGSRVGLTAVVITILSIAAGKYLAVELQVKKQLGGVEATFQEEVAKLQNEDYLISYLADDVAAEKQEAGEDLQWPEGVNPEEGGAGPADYPADVWASALEQWEALSPDQQEEFRTVLEGRVREGVEGYYQAVATAGFTGSFGVLDLLFFGLAIATAYRIAAQDLDGEPAASSEGSEPPVEA